MLENFSRLVKSKVSANDALEVATLTGKRRTFHERKQHVQRKNREYNLSCDESELSHKSSSGYWRLLSTNFHAEKSLRLCCQEGMKKAYL